MLPVLTGFQLGRSAYIAEAGVHSMWMALYTSLGRALCSMSAGWIFSLHIASAHAQSMIQAPNVLDPARQAEVSWRPLFSRVSQISLPPKGWILHSSKFFS